MILTNNVADQREALSCVRKAHQIAQFACEEQQPMPSEGIDDRLIAEACEYIGEGHARARRWFDCATAHRMACWYWRKAIDA